MQGFYRIRKEEPVFFLNPSRQIKENKLKINKKGAG
jgi:hypothetical protein